MDTIWIILILIFASLAGTTLLAVALMRGRRNTEALRTLCQQEGWFFEPDIGPGGSTTRISDSRKGWRLDIIHATNRDGSGPGARRTVWTDPRAGIPAGLAVAAPALPADKADGIERAMSMMGGRMGQTLLVKVFGALGADATQLRAVEFPGGRGLFMATPDARDALRVVALQPDLAGAAATLPAGAMPAILRSADGLQLRVRATWTDPGRIRDLVALGEALSTALRG